MTKNVKIGAAIFLSGVCATSGHAVQTSPHDFTIGLLGNYYQYRETSHNKFLMHFKGYMVGGLAGYSYTTQEGFLFGAEIDFSGGAVNYDSNRTGSMSNVKQNKFEGRLKSGKNFHMANGLTLTPYTGFGVRVKSDYMGGRRTSTGHIGYDRRSTYLYIPVGTKLKKQLSSDWAVEAFGEFDIFLHGIQHSDGVGNHPATTHTQKRGYGVRGNIEAVKTFSKKHSLSFGPFINFWHVKDSNIVKNSMEPNNQTIEAGVALKYRF